MRLRLALCLAAPLLVARASSAQDTRGVPNGVSFPKPGSIYGPDVDSDNSNLTPAQRRVSLLNAERRQAIVADTGKLLKLVTEFNVELTASKASQVAPAQLTPAQLTPAQLTPAQLRKLADIEKLARGVKQKMQASLGAM